MKPSVGHSLVAVFFVSLLVSPILGLQQNMQVISSQGIVDGSDAILILEADFETGTFEEEDVETFTWPDGPPIQVVEISDAFAYSGSYSVKCAGTTTSDGMKARVCAGKWQGVDVLPVVGSIMEGHVGAWFLIREWAGSSVSLLDFRCHVPADPYPTDHYIGTFWIWANHARLRFDFPDFGSAVNVPFDGLTLMDDKWHLVEFGFKIGVYGFYKVWVDDKLLIKWYGDNSKLASGWGERLGYDTPPADRAFAGITARGSDGEHCEIYVDDFIVTS